MANNPTGIRYDKTKVDFIKKRENLKSIQQVVNFLVDQYWWQNKPLRLPADYVDTNNLEFTNSEPGSLKHIAINKGTNLVKKIKVKDLNKMTGKKVISDPPPKTNYAIDTTKPKSKETDYLAKRRKLKQ